MIPLLMSGLTAALFALAARRTGRSAAQWGLTGLLSVLVPSTIWRMVVGLDASLALRAIGPAIGLAIAATLYLRLLRPSTGPGHGETRP